MTTTVNRIPDYQGKWKKAEENLKRLEELLLINDPALLREKYRLLPLSPLYLVASHYTTDRIAWSVKTKWNLFKIFDKDMREGSNPEGVRSAITAAAACQRDIALLRKIFAAVMDPSKKTTDKSLVCSEVKQQCPSLYAQIKRCLWAANNNNPDLKDREVEKDLDSPLIKGGPHKNDLFT